MQYFHTLSCYDLENWTKATKSLYLIDFVYGHHIPKFESQWWYTVEPVLKGPCREATLCFKAPWSECFVVVFNKYYLRFKATWLLWPHSLQKGWTLKTSLTVFLEILWTCVKSNIFKLCRVVTLKIKPVTMSWYFTHSGYGHHIPKFESHWLYTFGNIMATMCKMQYFHTLWLGKLSHSQQKFSYPRFHPWSPYNWKPMVKY